MNNRLCAVLFQTSIVVIKHNLETMCIYISSDCRSEVMKHHFNRHLLSLLTVTNIDLLLVSGDLNSQVYSFRHLGLHFGVDTHRALPTTVRRPQLYLSSIAFQHKHSYRVTWCPPNSSMTWIQIHRISNKWRTSVQHCRLVWSTCLHSDHVLVRVYLALILPSFNEADNF